jgi:hypothetical protein
MNTEESFLVSVMLRIDRLGQQNGSDEKQKAADCPGG